MNDGFDLVTMITVTYNDDGSIQSTGMVTDQIVAWNTRYTGKVEHNQKVFVWSAKALDGTIMQPLCAPILGSDFAD